MKDIFNQKMHELCDTNLFGILSYTGERLGVASTRIRMFFIYISFLTFGSPVFIYLALGFLINLNRYIRNRRRNPVWDF